MAITTQTAPLPEELSAEIISSVQEESIVQKLAKQQYLPGNGSTVRVISSDAEANWVAEKAQKPVDDAEVSSVIMQPYKVALIEVFTQELIEDDAALYSELSSRLPLALAKKFDQTVLGGTAPGSNFDVLSDVTAISLDDGYYDASVTALETVATAGGNVSGFALSKVAEAQILGEKDSQGRPLFIFNPQTDGSVANLLGRPVFTSNHVQAAPSVGFAGDWTTARWGVVDGITVKVSDQAVVRGESMFETNQVALLVEARFGFIAPQKNKFVRFTAPTVTP